MLMAMLVVMHGNANKLGGRASSDYTTNDKFAILSGTIIGDGSSETLAETLSFPEGFNNNNCVIISAMVQNTKSQIGTWGTGTIFNSSGYLTGALPCKATISQNGVTIEIKNIVLMEGQNPLMSNINATFNYKIILMLID